MKQPSVPLSITASNISKFFFSSLPKQAEYRMELLAFCHVFISYLPAYSKIFNRYESFSCQKQNIKFKAFAGGHQLPLITARVFLENHTYHGN